MLTSMKRTVAILAASMMLGALSTSAILAWSEPTGTGLDGPAAGRGLPSPPATAKTDDSGYTTPLGSIDECTYEPDLAAWFVSGQTPEKIQVREYQSAFYKALRDMRLRYGLNSAQVKIAGLEVTEHSEAAREIKMTLRANNTIYVYDAATERVTPVEPR